MFALTLSLGVTGVIVSVLSALLLRGQADTSEVSALFTLLWRTTTQASLSALSATVAGAATAWALHRLRFPGHGLLVGLLSVAIVTPGIVMAFAILAIWGRSGFLADVSNLIGLPWSTSPFGLHAVLLAHTALSGALVARTVLAGLQSLPDQTIRLSRSLRLSDWQRFTLVEWPLIWSALPSAASLAFLFSFTSFPIVLLLGGGPAVTSFEVAIFQSVRLSFDLARAGQLAVIQLTLCALFILPTLIWAPSLTTGQALSRLSWPSGQTGRWAASIALLCGLALIIVPVIVPLLPLLDGQAVIGVLARPATQNALITSLLVAMISATLTTLGAWLFVSARASFLHPALRVLLSLPAYAYLAVPAVVLSLGAFLIVQALGFAPSRAAVPVLILANVMLALPIAITILSPSLNRIQTRYQRLQRALIMGWAARLRFVEAPLLASDLGTVWSLAFCFSLGDLGIISLFGTEDISTLPWLIFRAMGSYRTNDAAILAGLLLLLCLGVMLAVPALIKKVTAHA